jgi:hypothetical protein
MKRPLLIRRLGLTVTASEVPWSGVLTFKPVAAPRKSLLNSTSNSKTNFISISGGGNGDDDIDTGPNKGTVTKHGPSIPEKLWNKKLPDCSADLSYDTMENKGSFWSESGAEQWVEEYINAQKDHSQWAQKLYKDLFPKADRTVFLCTEPGAQCHHGKECGKDLQNSLCHICCTNRLLRGL